MRLPHLLLTILIAVLAGGSGKGQSTCGDFVLPPRARALFNQKFPEWRIKATSDLEGYDKALWLKEHPRECPGIAFGHFENPRQIAFGLLLVPKSAAAVGFKLVVLVKSESEENYL